MSITIGGLGNQIEFPCPVCSVNMEHWAVATQRNIRYEYQCNDCELSVKADRLGNSKLLKEMENA